MLEQTSFKMCIFNDCLILIMCNINDNALDIEIFENFCYLLRPHALDRKIYGGLIWEYF